MPIKDARKKDKSIDIFLDDDDIPILPDYNKDGTAKELQRIFRAFVTAHYSQCPAIEVLTQRSDDMHQGSKQGM
jgi:hypothetical protein